MKLQLRENTLAEIRQTIVTALIEKHELFKKQKEDFAKDPTDFLHWDSCKVFELDIEKKTLQSFLDMLNSIEGNGQEATLEEAMSSKFLAELKYWAKMNVNVNTHTRESNFIGEKNGRGNVLLFLSQFFKRTLESTFIFGML